jgi:hypothetical protein
VRYSAPRARHDTLSASGPHTGHAVAGKATLRVQVVGLHTNVAVSAGIVNSSSSTV